MKEELFFLTFVCRTESGYFIAGAGSSWGMEVTVSRLLKKISSELDGYGVESQTIIRNAVAEIWRESLEDLLMRDAVTHNVGVPLNGRAEKAALVWGADCFTAFFGRETIGPEFKHEFRLPQRGYFSHLQ